MKIICLGGSLHSVVSFFDGFKFPQRINFSIRYVVDQPTVFILLVWQGENLNFIESSIKQYLIMIRINWN